jgi:hypothetical protein
VFQLIYTQHGGSGLGLSMTDVMGLDLGRISWFLERLDEQRRREVEEIRRAARSARGR